jgi:hypothetical protein
VKKIRQQLWCHLPTLNHTTEVTIPLDVQKSNALKKNDIESLNILGV